MHAILKRKRRFPPGTKKPAIAAARKRSLLGFFVLLLLQPLAVVSVAQDTVKRQDITLNSYKFHVKKRCQPKITKGTHYANISTAGRKK